MQLRQKRWQQYSTTAASSVSARLGQEGEGGRSLALGARAGPRRTAAAGGSTKRGRMGYRGGTGAHSEWQRCSGVASSALAAGGALRLSADVARALWPCRHAAYHMGHCSSGSNSAGLPPSLPELAGLVMTPRSFLRAVQDSRDTPSCRRGARGEVLRTELVWPGAPRAAAAMGGMPRPASCRCSRCLLHAAPAARPALRARPSQPPTKPSQFFYTASSLLRRPPIAVAVAAAAIAVAVAIAAAAARFGCKAAVGRRLRPLPLFGLNRRPLP